MYHYTRCGSTVLSNIISQSDEYTCYGEVYNPDNAFFWSDSKPTEINFNDLKNSVDSHYQGLESTPLIEITRYDLQRLNCTNFFNEILPKLNEEFDLYILHLKRLNILQRIISSDMAEQTQIYHLKSDSENPSSKTLYKYEILELVQRVKYEMQMVLNDQLQLIEMNTFE